MGDDCGEGDGCMISVGDELFGQQFVISCFDLVCYVGVLGDFNLIYWNECFVQLVGLFDVIVYGMFMMVIVVWVVIDWLGDFGVVEDYSVCFIWFVVVFDFDGIVFEVCGVVCEDFGDGWFSVDFMVIVVGQIVLVWVCVIIWDSFVGEGVMV